ncbi:cytochrome P450 27C1 isoform X2 [Felis catus]|uniref:cytochrome P450 27C1 isoform X2 n=1 Tax=Felis catus TaxID=9685 RepID=UPI001D198AF8|nr:cytochrome P450 27C1 isoform X2 [Felis catus]
MPRRNELEEAPRAPVKAKPGAAPKGSSLHKKVASVDPPTWAASMALLARVLKARGSPAPGRWGLLDAGAPRRWRPEGSRLSAGARAEDKGAGRRGAPRAGGRTEGPRSLAVMPGPHPLANLVEFFWKDGFGRIHEIQKHTREYGKIFKSHFGPQFVVSIADRDMVAQVLRAEGAAPQRANMGSWQEYRHLRGRSTGLISAEGEQWLKMRRVLRQRILKPRDVAIFSGEINQVIADLIKRIYILRSQAEDGETVTSINDLFFKYSMEGVATILYESRLGCLENSVPQLTVDYIEALGLMFSMFKTSMYAGAIPRWLRPFVPKPWREFCRSWDGLFKFSQIHVDNKLRDIQCHMDRGETVRGGLLSCLFLSQELTLEEIYANMTEMLLAGVDTTSFTLSWAVYLLARHPEVQQTVYREIVKNLGERHVPTAADVPKVPLVRALLKETLRLFPVLPGNGRVTQEDLVVGGYLIPKGTQLALCHYATSYEDENFPRAKEFRPERWLRKGSLDRVDNFGSIPFGFGVRSCIGRRIAELEIHLVVIQSNNIGEKHPQEAPSLYPGSTASWQVTSLPKPLLSSLVSHG